MEYNHAFLNHLIEEEIAFSNQLSLKYGYPDNITHLLYIIIPAFILKYGTNHKHLLENCFMNVPIIIHDKQDHVYQAYYFSKPSFRENDITVIKGIVLQNYQNIGLMQLLDNLVHEFNHAVNSLQNEVKVEDYISIRTGLVYNSFDKKNLSFVKKSEEIILEEVINTTQTESIIHIIRDFSNYEIDNVIVQNTLYSIYHAIDSHYRSNSYLIESTICQQLLQNKTFLSTVETLRFNGQIEDIHHFFDSIVGKEGTWLELSRYLNQSIELQKQFIHTKWFKKHQLQQIRNINQKALAIVQKFDQNTVYR